MVILYILKILAEGGFLLIIAGPILAAFGVSPVFLPIMYVLYAVYIFASGRSQPKQDHQIGVFKYSVWAAFAMLFGCLLFSASLQVMTVLVGSALLSMTSSVLLLRSLRHDPEIYRSRSFQTMNLLIMTAVLAVIFLVSSRPVMHAMLLTLEVIYQAVVAVFVRLVMALVQVIVVIASLLSKLFGFQGFQIKGQEIELSGLNEQQFAENNGGIVGAPLWLKLLLCGAGTAVILLAVWYLLRRLSGSKDYFVTEEVRKDNIVRSASSYRDNLKTRESSAVQGVRKQYRKYLQMLRERGQLIEKADTSEEIEQYPLSLHEGAEAKELRNIYIRARYGGEISERDQKRAAELVKEIRKNKGEK